MDICKGIFEKCETALAKKDEQLYSLVLEEFLKLASPSVDFGYLQTAGEKVRYLQSHYVYNSPYCKEFFDILKKHGYYISEEIKDAIFYLGHLERHNNNKDLITKLLNSPVIDDITFNGKNKFTITSEELGEYSFYVASLYFKNNPIMKEYIRTHELPNKCHQHVYFMSNAIGNTAAVTSICPVYFVGKYYHSYTWDQKNNFIIDLCSNAIMEKNDYYRLFEPEELSVILSQNIEDELAYTNLKSSQPLSRHHLLKIALYKQYLQSIGYSGSLEKAPYVR